jgi:hypothetical protein
LGSWENPRNLGPHERLDRDLGSWENPRNLGPHERLDKTWEVARGLGLKFVMTSTTGWGWKIFLLYTFRPATKFKASPKLLVNLLWKIPAASLHLATESPRHVGVM